MIQTVEKFDIQADGLMASAKFSLKEENLAHVFNILRNNLYSNKVLAVIREYSTNAFDANVENNKSDVPIEITLPNMLEPSFKVRDFGKGLSEDDVFNIYSSYGASTKRGSNQFVGTLGMGSKSGFAYANSFTITSWHGGMKKIYEAFIDETNIGTIAKVYECKSDESTGIEVLLTVNPSDISSFIDTACKFYAWFDPMPKFFGHDPSDKMKSYFNNCQETFLDDPCPNIKLFDCRYNYGFNALLNHGSVNVVMGNIMYPVKDSYYAEIGADMIQNRALVIYANIGEFSFTTSREELEMTPKTINSLKGYMNEFKRFVAKKADAQIKACKSPWELYLESQKWDTLIRSAVGETVKWRGKDISLRMPAGDYCSFNTYNKKWEKNNWRISYQTSSDSVVFIVNDGGFPAYQLRSRLKAMHAKLTKRFPKGEIKYYRGSVEASVAFLDCPLLKGAKIFKLSSLTKFETARSSAKFSQRQKFFKWDGSAYFPFSSCWESVDIDINNKKSRVYVKINAFRPLPLEAFNGSMVNMRDYVKRITQVTGKELEIYGVKPGQEIPDGWISLTEYSHNLVKKLQKNKEYIEYSSEEKMRDIMREWGIFSSYRTSAGWSSTIPIECPEFQELVDVFKNADSMSKRRSDDRMNIIENFIQCNGNHELREDFNKKIMDTLKHKQLLYIHAANKYPLIKHMTVPGSYSNNTTRLEWEDNVVRYVNAMCLAAKN